MVHDTTRIYDEPQANSDMHTLQRIGRFITWTQAGQQFIRISYDRIGHFIPDINC
jgi:hypothetical protein